MIGMDAGPPISLAAMNKPLRANIAKNFQLRADQLSLDNYNCLQISQDVGLLVRAGFVIGHIGMTPSLLVENVDMIKQLIRSGRQVISALDIEVLSPQPGSFDFDYLTNPASALDAAARLNLTIGRPDELHRVAERWRDEDKVIPEEAMRDYAGALMPGVEFSQLAEARSAIRNFAKEQGIIIGE